MPRAARLATKQPSQQPVTSGLRLLTRKSWKACLSLHRVTAEPHSPPFVLGPHQDHRGQIWVQNNILPIPRARSEPERKRLHPELSAFDEREPGAQTCSREQEKNRNRFQGHR